LISHLSVSEKMGVSRIYLSLFTFLFALSSFGAIWAQEESSRQQGWLVTDTLDLPLSDPSYEVGFFRDEIIFLTPAFEGVGRVPMDDPKLANRQPLFVGDVFPFSPASLSFAKDYAMCYATGQKEVWDDFRLEKIFTLSVEQGYSSRLQALSFTFDSCRYLHPAIAANDSMLIFSSDRLPTSGGLDLFVSRLDSTGWSQPESLGSSINSAGHDRYPFLDNENNLWFASTGHKGYGAYDLYVCLYNGQGWEGPQNLGPTINTNYDEIGFSMHEGAQVVLFTRKSLREGMALRLVNKDKADYSISLVLMNQANPPSEPQEEVIPEPDPDPVSEPQASLPEEAVESAQLSVKDPERLLFRVQILSSNQAGSTPHVVINGIQYTTYEYLFKGSYRITVGEFETVEDANKFRLQCKQAGYNQAFVAAFRGNKRETDPSVFKK
jgi:hypothetical protein